MTTATAPAKATAPVKAEKVFTIDDATKLDARIRATAERADNVMAALAQLIAVARANNVHALLGFDSWKDYVADVCSKNMPMLHQHARKPLSVFMCNNGLTEREAAQALGVSQKQINLDRKAARGEQRDQSQSPVSRVRRALEQPLARYSDDDLVAVLAMLSKATRGVKAEQKRRAAELNGSKQRHPAGKKAATAKSA